MEKQRKHGRERYAQDYEVRESPGRYFNKRTAVYTGAYYGFDMQDKACREYKALLCALLSACALLFVLGGACRPASLGGKDGQVAAYVILPYAVLLLPTFMCLGKAICLCLSGPALTYSQYDKYVVLLRLYTALSLFMAAGVGICQGAYMIARAPRPPVKDAGFLLCLAAQSALSFCALKLQRRNPCKQVRRGSGNKNEEEK